MVSVPPPMDSERPCGQEQQHVQHIPGILDQQTLEHLLNVEFARARRYEHPFSLLRLRGRERDLTREIAGALRLHTRWADSVGILDSESLLVILRDTAHEAAQLAAAKIRDLLAEELDAQMMQNLVLESAAWRKGDDLARLLARLR